MKRIGLLGVAALAAATGFAQVRGGGTGPGGSNFGSRSGFGSVVFPGTGRAPNLPPSGVFAHPNSNSRGRSAGGATQGQGRSVVYWPIGYAGYGYGDGYQQEPNVIVVNPPTPQAAAPTVVINQHFTPEVARPVVREYTTDPNDGIRIYEDRPRQYGPPPGQAANGEEKKSYLIAFKDHTIYAAFTYWMEGETLHYVTTHGTHNQVSLDLVDRELTDRLNRERGVDFTIPARK
jgi:hypothetical protein